jgi:hypothetical protein
MEIIENITCSVISKEGNTSNKSLTMLATSPSFALGFAIRRRIVSRRVLILMDGLHDPCIGRQDELDKKGTEVKAEANKTRKSGWAVYLWLHF